jgi:hypothetical protein
MQLGDQHVSQFVGQQNERVSCHEFDPVDPLLLREAFETRTVQGGLRGGLDPLSKSRLGRLSLLCLHRTRGEQKGAERGPQDAKTEVSHVHRHFVRTLTTTRTQSVFGSDLVRLLGIAECGTRARDGRRPSRRPLRKAAEGTQQAHHCWHVQLVAKVNEFPR